MSDGFGCELAIGWRRSGRTRLVAAPVFEGIFPMGREAVSTASLLYLDAGRDGDAGYGEADHLALTAAEAADGVAHEEYFGEVLRPKTGSAEVLAVAILATDRSAVGRLGAEVRRASVGGVSAAGALLVFVLESRLQLLPSSGRSGRLKSFSATP